MSDTNPFTNLYQYINPTFVPGESEEDAFRAKVNRALEKIHANMEVMTEHIRILSNNKTVEEERSHYASQSNAFDDYRKEFAKLMQLVESKNSTSHEIAKQRHKLDQMVRDFVAGDLKPWAP